MTLHLSLIIMSTVQLSTVQTNLFETHILKAFQEGFPCNENKGKRIHGMSNSSLNQQSRTVQ